MMKKAITLIGLLSIAMIVGCVTTSEAPGGTYEIEDFKLSGVEVKDNATASGGKTVLLLSGGKAEKTINLKKGVYEVTVYAQGASSEEDAFDVMIGDQVDERSYQNDDNDAVGPTMQSPYGYTQDADGTCKVVIAYSDEDNVQVDRIVFELQ